MQNEIKNEVTADRGGQVDSSGNVNIAGGTGVQAWGRVGLAIAVAILFGAVAWVAIANEWVSITRINVSP